MTSEDVKYKHNGAASPDGADVEPALTPISLVNTDSPAGSGFSPLVTVVGFHHARGPEVETWFGADEGVDPAIKYNWPLLPFMALSDGAHAYVVPGPLLSSNGEAVLLTEILALKKIFRTLRY